jgi:hypothetical protein
MKKYMVTNASKFSKKSSHGAVLELLRAGLWTSLIPKRSDDRWVYRDLMLPGSSTQRSVSVGIRNLQADGRKDALLAKIGTVLSDKFLSVPVVNESNTKFTFTTGSAPHWPLFTR